MRGKVYQQTAVLPDGWMEKVNNGPHMSLRVCVRPVFHSIVKKQCYSLLCQTNVLFDCENTYCIDVCASSWIRNKVSFVRNVFFHMFFFACAPVQTC